MLWFSFPFSEISLLVYLKWYLLFSADFVLSKPIEFVHQLHSLLSDSLACPYISSAERHDLAASLPSCMPAIDLSYLIAPANTSGAMLSKSSEGPPLEIVS